MGRWGRFSKSKKKEIQVSGPVSTNSTNCNYINRIHKGSIQTQRGKKCLRVWSFNNLKNLKKIFRSFTSLSYWVNGFCLAFVIWQTIKCMTKYIENPKATEISMKKSANLPFPAITLCGSFGKTWYGIGGGFNSIRLA